MQPAVSLVFFVVLLFNLIFMLLTQRTIWRGILAVHKHDCPILYWFHFWCTTIPLVVFAAYDWRDWLALFR